MKSLLESIIKSNNIGVAGVVKDILCSEPNEKNLRKLQRLWVTLGLDVKGYQWKIWEDSRGYSLGYAYHDKLGYIFNIYKKGIAESFSYPITLALGGRSIHDYNIWKDKLIKILDLEIMSECIPPYEYAKFK